MQTNERNYIYLDIDGVLNGEAHPIRSEFHKYLEFIPNAVQNLRFLIKETNSSLIISSSWRGVTDEDLQKLIKIFDWYDLGQYIVGQTPILPTGWREDEILCHMKKNKISIDNIVVIDDDDFDIRKKLGHRLIHVDRRKGFTYEDRQKAKALLIKNFNYKN